MRYRSIDDSWTNPNSPYYNIEDHLSGAMLREYRRQQKKERGY